MGLESASGYPSFCFLIEDKIPDLSGLLKKMDCNAKISDIETKFFTNFDYNKFTSQIIETKIIEKMLVDKSSISNLVKKVLI